jgi:hypothetical protein
MDTAAKQVMITHLINEGEKDEAVQLLSDWSDQTSFKDVIFRILEPLLVSWGKLWMQGKLSLAHGYLSGKVAEEFYLIAAKDPSFNSLSVQSKGTIRFG